MHKIFFELSHGQEHLNPEHCFQIEACQDKSIPAEIRIESKSRKRLCNLRPTQIVDEISPNAEGQKETGSDVSLHPHGSKNMMNRMEEKHFFEYSLLVNSSLRKTLSVGTGCLQLPASNHFLRVEGFFERGGETTLFAKEYRLFQANKVGTLSGILLEG